MPAQPAHAVSVPVHGPHPGPAGIVGFTAWCMILEDAADIRHQTGDSHTCVWMPHISTAPSATPSVSSHRSRAGQVPPEQQPPVPAAATAAAQPIAGASGSAAPAAGPHGGALPSAHVDAAPQLRGAASHALDAAAPTAPVAPSSLLAGPHLQLPTAAGTRVMPAGGGAASGLAAPAGLPATHHAGSLQSTAVPGPQMQQQQEERVSRYNRGNTGGAN